jgi:hypothetical protein
LVFASVPLALRSYSANGLARKATHDTPRCHRFSGDIRKALMT